MIRTLFAVALVLALDAVVRAEDNANAPWKTNPPIVTVKKELYLNSPQPGASALVFTTYVGPKLQLRESRGAEIVDDVHTARTERFSDDNGRTWSQPVKVPANDLTYEGVTVWEGNNYGPLFDPTSGRGVEMWLRQIAHGGLYHQSTYYRLSGDLGRTWSTPKLLRYEAGDDFNPKQPLAESFLEKNQAMFGNSILRHSNGTLILPVSHANAPSDPQNSKRAWRMGSLCFIGRWNAETKDYDWKGGQRVEISPEVSSRGLMEPDAAELSDGRVLVVWRQSSTAKTPGRKLYAISADGGLTLSYVNEWKYDDGSSFYSPSSIHRFIRHSVTKKLYWIGNITPTAPAGNSPRYPLVLAEVDEALAALKRNTVSLIDDRQENQTADIQFSNFSLYEDRETHELVLHLTCYGEFPGSVYTAHNYRYRLTLK